MQQFDSRTDLQKMLQKFLDGRATDEEIQFIESYYKFFDKEADRLNIYPAYQKQLLGEEIELSIKERTGARGRIIPFFPIWRKLMAVASIFIVVSVGAWLYVMDNEKIETAENRIMKRDIAPGSDRAILTLADGSQITLDSTNTGLLAKQGNVMIRKTPEGQLIYNPGAGEESIRYNTVSTPAGGEFRITLPDGSKVWLNAMSSIKFPTVFSQTERTVKVNGEVYFEVAKNPDKPFIVDVNSRQRITVLGTHFNINAYQDEGVVKTTLLEGRVKLSGYSEKAELVDLYPGQQASLTAAHGITVRSSVDTEEVMAWKNGLFRFDKTDMGTVMRQLARWYDVTVEYEGAIPNRKFSGKIHRNVNASEALDILSFTGVHFRIEAPATAGGKKRIIVMP